ncbi:MAG: hypothetical protein AAB900_01900 [Patescibacteria group bacterium]
MPSSKGNQVLVEALILGIERYTLDMSDFSTIGLGCLLELVKPPLRARVLKAFVERDVTTGVNYNQLTYLIDRTGLPPIIKKRLKDLREARRISSTRSTTSVTRRSAVA